MLNQEPEFVDLHGGDIYQTGFDDYNLDYTNSKRREDAAHRHHNPIGGHHSNQFTATPQHHGHHDENDHG